jgi:hypothetical protein
MWYRSSPSSFSSSVFRLWSRGSSPGFTLARQLHPVCGPPRTALRDQQPHVEAGELADVEANAVADARLIQSPQGCSPSIHLLADSLLSRLAAVRGLVHPRQTFALLRQPHHTRGSTASACALCPLVLAHVICVQSRPYHRCVRTSGHRPLKNRGFLRSPGLNPMKRN